MKATAREKAILAALAAGFVESWKEAYNISRDKPDDQTKSAKNLPSIVTRWKQRPDIAAAYNSAILALEIRDKRNQEQGRQEARREAETEGGKEGRTAGESERTKARKAGPVDYYNPANQRERINAIIEAAQDDPKTQLDAIKAIQQTQRDDRQAAKDDKIQRFFTPIQCKTCPLKAKKAGKLNL